MIRVYQIQLSDLQIQLLNEQGWGVDNPKIRAYGRRGLGRVEDVDMEFYTPVAVVQTDDLEEAFELMNLWEQPDRIVALAPFMASMSVGDVVETEDGRRFLCAPIGFEEIL